MKADAPGKLVVSGAYSVLFGGPALVTAVSRRVYADSMRRATFDSKEVSCGMELLKNRGPLGQRPWYDASELRQDSQKLGLGSSAAICVASLGVLLAEQLSAQHASWTLSSLRSTLEPIALAAHQRAQGGGSGIDVAAACFGGTVAAQKQSNSTGREGLKITPTTLPSELHFEVWASPQAASTAAFVSSVRKAKEATPEAFDAVMTRQTEASALALHAAQQDDSLAFVHALRAQFDALTELGTIAAIEIITKEVKEIQEFVPSNACFIPSGAGGGDVNLYVGRAESDALFRTKAAQLELQLVSLTLGAPGLQISPSL